MPPRRKSKKEDDEANYDDDFERADGDDDDADDDDDRELHVEDDVEKETDDDEEDDEEDEEDEGEYEEDAEQEGEEEEEVILDDELVVSRSKAKVKYYPSLFGQILTKYEKTALLGYRAQQIVSGAEIYVVTNPNDTPLSIAERELKENKLPYYIQRKLPDGNIISVKLDQLLDIF